MCKAYDRVEWVFLQRVMEKLGFSNGWIGRIMNCISTVSLSFKVNGEVYGNVKPTRGLRQGDPISPYLFILCADAFSELLNKSAREKKLHGTRMIASYLRTTTQECSIIVDIIRVYERALGQKVNLDKTEVAFSRGVPVDRRGEIVRTLGVREVEKHNKYLGLPTIIGRSKKEIFARLKERLWKSLNVWNNKLLSKPGKEVLIKAVAQDIPTYMMSIFKIPDGVIDEFHTMLFGDGRSIKIWEDQWISRNGKPSCLMSPADNPSVSWVHELINEEGTAWDCQQLERVLGYEAQYVMPILNAQYRGPDLRYWYYTKTGYYTVKSGYWLARSLGSTSTTNQAQNNCWRLIWRTRLPPKIQHFLWSACKGNLAVGERLQQRHISQGQRAGCADAPTNSFAARWLWLGERIGKEELTKVATLCWAAWRCRNMAMFEESSPNAVMLATNFCKWSEDHFVYKQRVQHTTVVNSSLSTTRWVCPPTGMFKLNVDAHVAGGGNARLGVVIRDEAGTIALTATKRVVASDVATLEARAVRFGMNVALRFNFGCLWVESDSLIVINSVEANRGGITPLCLVITDILKIRVLFNVCVFSHVKRNGNSVAHLVARGEMGCESELIRLDSFPQSVVTLANLDLV
ncbi:uncharacterized protein LOC110734567 [Chenopodium quinoa]|uniref:uncharacterized protein LOC110734567 n=1 Tax=Chenopodium quinoa TaxID=63459 RepID=UPI000B77A69A|nr:uncharacterized protein LOC110734567 [Chenopodium quinoa]